MAQRRMSLQRLEEVYFTYLNLNEDDREAGKALGIADSTVRRHVRRYKEVMRERAGTEKKKILVFDIETAPYEGYFWDRWKQNIPMCMVKKEWSILCWAAKWLDGTEIFTASSWDDNDDVRDDKHCCSELAKLLDMADVTVSHNGDRFDVKRVMTRLLVHGLDEPSPFKSVDTLKICKNRFELPSNKLDDIGKALGVGQKVSHSGWSMWEDVLKGCQESRDKMLEYNVGDITLLEQVYMKIRSWDKRHPNVNIDFGDRKCPVCGSVHLKQVNDVYTNVSTFAALRCLECGKYSRTGMNKKNKQDMQLTQRNIV